MTIYALFLVLHVLSAVVLLGGSLVAAPLVHGAARRARTADELRTVLTLGRPLGRINPAASTLVLATGACLSTLLHGWGQPWVQVAVVAWVVNVIVARRVVAPHMGRLAAEAFPAPAGPVSPQARALLGSRRWAAGVGVLVANDAALVVLMTIRPGFATAGSVLLVAHLVAAGLSALGRARQVRRRLASEA